MFCHSCAGRNLAFNTFVTFRICNIYSSDDFKSSDEFSLIVVHPGY